MGVFQGSVICFTSHRSAPVTVVDEGFEEKWFERLADLDENTVGVLKSHEYPNLRPTLGDLRERNLIGDLLADRATSLVDTINSNYGRDLYSDFRAIVHHVYTYTRKRSFRRQKNIAFTAEGESWHLRVGIGFDVDRSMKEDGVEDYNDFIQKVDDQPEKFDGLISRLGGYVEPRDGTARPDDLSDRAKRLGASDFFLRPDLHPERHSISWRFFGAKLRFNDPAHRWIMVSQRRLARFANRVFEEIEASPF